MNDKVDMNSSLCFFENGVVQCHNYKQSFLPNVKKYHFPTKKKMIDKLEKQFAKVAIMWAKFQIFKSLMLSETVYVSVTVLPYFPNSFPP